MKIKTFILFSILTFACSINAQEKYPHRIKYKGNPLARLHSATDPDAHVWNDTLWVYCSQDNQKRDGDRGNYDAMDGYHVYSTADMVNWTDHGEILHTRDIDWGRDGFLWAPAATYKNGTYYLYYPHRNDENKWRVGIAISNRPDGPFKDTGKFIEGVSGSDPMVFIDDDGDAYIYWNKENVAKLKSNMMELAEPARKVVYASEEIMQNDTLKFCEGSYMHKYNGKYYYSYTNFKNPVRHGFYAVGDSPYGPFEWKGAMAYQPIGGEQDHHSIIEFKGEWYYFYHYPGNDMKPKGWNGSRRLMCFEKLEYNEDGTIKMVKQTRQRMSKIKR